VTTSGTSRFLDEQMADFERYFDEAAARLARQEDVVRALARKGRKDTRAVARLMFLREAFQAIQSHYESLILANESEGQSPASAHTHEKSIPHFDSALLNALTAITRVARNSANSAERRLVTAPHS